MPRYAEIGTEFAGQSGGTTSVWLPVSAARAYAALGNGERALTAIHAAENTWDHVEPDAVDELGGICTFNQPRTVYYATDALAWLPAEADAVTFSTRAVAAYADHSDPAWAFGDEAGFLAHVPRNTDRPGRHPARVPQRRRGRLLGHRRRRPGHPVAVLRQPRPWTPHKR